jgi:DNA-binding transcriptional ArsR family regulator
VERFASMLVETGWPRMPARVFVTLVASDAAQLTASELADALQVSPAGVSGAVRYLAQLGLVSREREPGSRRDLYRVHDDIWYDVIVGRLRVMAKWDDSLREGQAAAGDGSVAAERLGEMAAFFEFLRGEIPDLMRRWHDRRGR